MELSIVNGILVHKFPPAFPVGDSFRTNLYSYLDANESSVTPVSPNQKRRFKAVRDGLFSKRMFCIFARDEQDPVTVHSSS